MSKLRTFQYYERNMTTRSVSDHFPVVILIYHHVGCGGSLVDSSPFVRRVAGTNPTLAAT